MLSVQQQQQQQLQFVPEEKNFRTTEKDQDFYFLGQHLNSPGLLIEEEEEEYPTEYYNSPPNNFEVANRAFYATINKFTRQSCPDASRRRSAPYSFLENWHLHSIYSKSQQTLLGITPVRPSVLLSGDDFMFTPPFIQQEGEECCEEEEEEEDWSQTEAEYYNLSPCPDSNGAASALLYAEEDGSSFETSNSNHDNNKQYYNHHSQENIWIENESRTHNLNGFDHLSIHIQQNDDLLILQPQQEQEEEEYTTDSSSDEQHCSSDDEHEGLSSYDLLNLYDTDEELRQHPISPVTRSSSFLSQKSSSSVMSYQSLADIINKSNNNLEDRNNYGSIITTINEEESIPVLNNHAHHHNHDVEMGVQESICPNTHIWTRTLTYIMYIWELFILYIGKVMAFPFACARQDEREPLL